MRAFWDETELRHAPEFFLQRGQLRPNFEVPARAEALLAGCRDLGMEVVAPDAIGRAALLRVHDAGYLDFLRDAPAEWAAQANAGPEMVANIHPTAEMLAGGAALPASLAGRLGWFTADTSCPIGPETWASAQAAAACAVAAANEAADGRTAYALCRPPGHHAYAARAGGHCYLNNAGVAAGQLRARGAARVGILDIDAHHGNGTQGLFWERDDVVFASVHGDPGGYYPWYTGHANEAGAGAGAGCTVNLPLPRGSGDAAWLEAIGQAIAALRRCAVDALVVSLGFDASEAEPLRFLSVTEDGFARAGAAVAGLGLPAALVQEGGYNVDLLGRLLARFLDGFASK